MPDWQLLLRLRLHKTRIVWLSLNLYISEKLSMEIGRYHIIGAGRVMGRWFCQHLNNKGHTLYCYDIDPESLSSLPANINKCPIDIDHSYFVYADNFQDNDIILLAIPQAVLYTLEDGLQKSASRSLIVSLTSVQAEPLEILKKWKLTHQPMGCHPLFGATVPSPVGQLVALTNFSQAIQIHTTFSDHLRDIGIIPSHLNADQHDQLMALVQALPHFTFLVFAKCLTQLIDKPSALFEVRTPNFEFLHAFTCRFLKIAPSTTGSIQYAPDAKKIREHFILAAQDLHNQFEVSNTIEQAADVIIKTREPLTGSHVDEGVQIAALAVDSIQRFENLLHRHFVSQAPFVFKNRITNEIHVVCILNNNSTEIEYEEATIMRDGLYAIGLDETSRNNYANIGLSFGKTYRDKIKKRNVVLLDGNELSLFWRTMVLPLTTIINTENPHGFSDHFYEEWLPRLVSGVYSCTFIESYRKRGESERVTINIKFGARYKKNQIIDGIRNIIQEFNYNLR